VWSYSICAAAFDNKIPVYIAGNLLKTDIHDDIHIETRAWEEVRPDKPEGLEIINFAFDQVPAKFITGIITEFGIVKPTEVRETVEKEYPWMK
jgi:translation initiation factor 2B subunit (eIF-2B alpha/beta/delta family)